MINTTKIGRNVYLGVILGILSLSAYAERKSIDKVTIEYEVQADGTAKLKYAKNETSSKVHIKIDGKDVATLTAGDVNPQSAQINKTAFKYIRFDYPKSSGAILWKFEAPTATDIEEESPQENVPDIKEEAWAAVNEQKRDNCTPAYNQNSSKDPSSAMDIIDQDEFFGIEMHIAYIQKVENYTKALSESDNKVQFLIDNDIEAFLTDCDSMLRIKTREIPYVAKNAIVLAKIKDQSAQTKMLDWIISTLNTRINERQVALDMLKNAIDDVDNDAPSDHSLKEMIINYSIIGIIVLVLLIWITVAFKKRKSKSKSTQPAFQTQSQQESDPSNPTIVVRRRTTSILKRQSIDDVVNNPEYMLISSADFTPDSAVGNIYIKNSCIKDVYNMYAEDLRNSDNPKEDGCMVLGRWVLGDNNTYDISLETVVFPGDDAVFKEYELNFGGKIKLRIAEKLRKLRRETNLQYDLVCWIHSHPGLGVFFSNSDDSVQMQLRHAQHPLFLIAFVVDILTSDQEMGIFTFRKDGTMNSKGDLTKLYSLEEMYKWALGSDRASFNPENYFNILKGAKMQIPSCKGVELNNNSIIDLSQIVVEDETGVAGWAIGTTVEIDGNKEYVVSGIVKDDAKPTAGVIGVLLNVTHMSLPTIQRLVATESANLSFVMVYSSRQNTVTTIPVINGDLITDEHFYGEETIDDLKIWTRRKR